MSADDFLKMVLRAAEDARNYDNAEDPQGSYQARELVYEEYIRYMARGGVNSFHATKIAKIIRDGFAISKQSPK